MIIGDPCRLTCPYCGGHKGILSLSSGNTFNLTYWSDGKWEYPMLPSPSPIQYCPHCGKYYYYDDAEKSMVDVNVEEDDVAYLQAQKDGILYFPDSIESPEEEKKREEKFRRKLELQREAWENGWGELTFEQMDEAFEQLFIEGANEEGNSSLLIWWLYKYNDELGGRCGDGSVKEASESVSKRHAYVIAQLMAQDIDPLFLAELHREMGNFEKCIELASAYIGGDDAEADFAAKQIIEQARCKNTHVFPFVDLPKD